MPLSPLHKHGYFDMIVAQEKNMTPKIQAVIFDMDGCVDAIPSR